MIISEVSAGKSRANFRFSGYKADVPVLFKVSPRKREGQSSEVRASSNTPYNSIRFYTQFLHLLFCFEPYHSLMQ